MGLLEGQLERLAKAGFQLLPTFEITTHYVVERDGFIALVARCPDGSFGDIGSAGRLLEGRFAALVWKKEEPVFVAKDQEMRATSQEVDALRRFDADLRTAVSGTTGPRHTL